jgi:hypothetical protein
LEITQESLQFGMPGCNSKIWGGSVTVWAAILWYSVGPIITLHGQITAREYMDRLGNQVHPMIQTLFLNSALYQDDSASIHTQLELFSHV